MYLSSLLPIAALALTALAAPDRRDYSVSVSSQLIAVAERLKSTQSTADVNAAVALIRSHSSNIESAASTSNRSTKLGANTACAILSLIFPNEEVVNPKEPTYTIEENKHWSAFCISSLC